MSDDSTVFEYGDIADLRRVFSVVYTHLAFQSAQAHVTDEIFDALGELEERLINVIRERACH